MKRERHANARGWQMLRTEKGVLTFDPETWPMRVLRYLPLWCPLLLAFIVVWRHPERALILAVVTGVLGTLYSRREMTPTFFASRKRCGFGYTRAFRPDQAILLVPTSAAGRIHVLDIRKGISQPVWEYGDEADRERVLKEFGRFITKRGVVEEVRDELGRTVRRCRVDAHLLPASDHGAARAAPAP